MINSVKELLEDLYKKGKRKGVICIGDTATVQEAAALMVERGIKFLGVTHRTGQKRRSVGVISTTDTNAEFGASLRPSERLVSDLMKGRVITVKMSDSIDFAVGTLTAEKVRHVVVVDGVGKWKAVLSQDEAVKALMTNITEEEHFQAVHKAEFRT
jgi:predicted transcriptional regulator